MELMDEMKKRVLAKMADRTPPEEPSSEVVEQEVKEPEPTSKDRPSVIDFFKQLQGSQLTDLANRGNLEEQSDLVQATEPKMPDAIQSESAQRSPLQSTSPDNAELSAEKVQQIVEMFFNR